MPGLNGGGTKSDAPIHAPHARTVSRATGGPSSMTGWELNKTVRKWRWIVEQPFQHDRVGTYRAAREGRFYLGGSSSMTRWELVIPVAFER